MTCLYVGLIRVRPAFPLSCKTVYWWVKDKLLFYQQYSEEFPWISMN